MTISNRALNRRLSNLESCAQEAPEGTYERAKAAAEAIDEASNCIIRAFRERGFVCPNDDRLRDVEVAIYGLMLSGNPEECGLLTGEGFGEHMQNRALRGRLIREAIRDRDDFEAA